MLLDKSASAYEIFAVHFKHTYFPSCWLKYEFKQAYKQYMGEKTQSFSTAVSINNETLFEAFHCENLFPGFIPSGKLSIKPFPGGSKIFYLTGDINCCSENAGLIERASKNCICLVSFMPCLWHFLTQTICLNQMTTCLQEKIDLNLLNRQTWDYR